MAIGVNVDGTCDSRFSAVREAFVENFAAHGDVGAAVCLVLDGRPVIDLWGGVRDRRSGDPWRDDTIVTTFSSTKGVTAICANLLIERGLLDPDAPVARYWPEFAANGKADIPVRFVLSHRCGLPYVDDSDGELGLAEMQAWDPIVERLAGQRPIWEPGSAHGYHMRTYGWLTGELVRRVSGRRPARFFAEEIAGPLGLSYWIGLPDAEHHRSATLVPPDPPPAELLPMLAQLMGPGTLMHRVINSPKGMETYDERWNEPEYRRLELPSSTGAGDARSLARLYAACVGPLADGTPRLLSAATVAAASTVEAAGPDRVLTIFDSCYGLGFTLPPMLAPGCGPRSFGHPGAGGSLGFADPEAGLGFGYVMNRMSNVAAPAPGDDGQPGANGDPRTVGLVEAIYQAL